VIGKGAGADEDKCDVCTLDVGCHDLGQHTDGLELKAQAQDPIASDKGILTDTCYLASMKMLNMSGVKFRQHRLQRSIIIAASSK
jgi:hypothetical protein